MALRNPALDWDQLLDGGTYTLNLDDIGWQRGLNDLRAKIHYEADKRRAVAHTHKVDAVTLEFYAVGARIKLPLPSTGCNCGGGRRGPHVITCPVLKTWPTPLLPSDHPDHVPPPGRATRPATQPAARPAPRDHTPTPTNQALEPDEALLGPCTCGLAPACQPDCARFLDAAV